MKMSVVSKEFKDRYLSDKKKPMEFSVRAIVFHGPEHYHKEINNPKLQIDEKCMLIIRGCGPVGYPGAAEVVNMHPPDYLLKKVSHPSLVSGMVGKVEHLKALQF